jgi:hypothetical protein
VVAAGDLEADGRAEHILERGHMAVRGPELQLRIACGAEPRQVIVAARVQVDTGDRLRVAAVEPFGQSYHGRQKANDAPQRSAELTVSFVRLLGGGLSMVPREQRDHLDFLGIEPAEITVLDQVIRMPMVSFVADVHTDVVQQGAVLEPLALAIAEAVHAARLVENAERQSSHLLRVLRPVAAPLAELDDAAAADVGVALHFLDARAVAMDVIEDETFAQRQIAERQLLGAEAAQDRIEQHRAGDDEIGASRIESGDGQALFGT